MNDECYLCAQKSIASLNPGEFIPVCKRHATGQAPGQATGQAPVQRNMIIYCIGSLKNHAIPDVALRLREAGHEAFDDWWSSSEDCDDWWQAHERKKGRPYREAIYGYHARNVFEFDKYHLDRCDAGVLIMPAGRSGHAEFGYLVGREKPVFVLFLDEPEKFDVMHLFATAICFSVDELIQELAVFMKRGKVNMQPWNSER